MRTTSKWSSEGGIKQIIIIYMEPKDPNKTHLKNNSALAPPGLKINK